MLLLCVVVLCVFYMIMHLTNGITRSSACLVGKTALVTGASSGIGYQTVLSLASRGCRVIMADVKDMEESKNNVIKFTNNDNIVTKRLDLSSLESVRKFAADIVKTEPRLDILINNAGICASKQNKSKDGLHPVMQVNYFGHFLLTHLLIDLLKKSAPSRIVFNSSFMSFYNNLSFENLNHQDDLNSSLFKKILVYCNSKYAILIASDIFAKKLQGSGVTSNSVNPGLTNTLHVYQLLSHMKCSCIYNFVYNLFVWIFGKSVWEAAQVLVHVAVSKKLEKVTEKHFWECRPFVKPLGAYDERFCKEIWYLSEKYVDLAPHEKL